MIAPIVPSAVTIAPSPRRRGSGVQRRRATLRQPYLSSLVAPTPLTVPSSSRSSGRRVAISRSVASWKTTYAGTPCSLAVAARQARSRSNTVGLRSRRGRPRRPPRRSGARPWRAARGPGARAAAAPAGRPTSTAALVAVSAQRAVASPLDREQALGEQLADHPAPLAVRRGRCRCRRRSASSWPSCVDPRCRLAEQDVDRGARRRTAGRARARAGRPSRAASARRPCRPRSPAASRQVSQLPHGALTPGRSTRAAGRAGTRPSRTGRASRRGARPSRRRCAASPSEVSIMRRCWTTSASP